MIPVVINYIILHANKKPFTTQYIPYREDFYMKSFFGTTTTTNLCVFICAGPMPFTTISPGQIPNFFTLIFT